MPENKTKATDASVKEYLAAIDDEARRKDCAALANLMAKATKQPPRMWGTSIVGLGRYRYRYPSGREGESCVVGFSSRKDNISVYGLNTAAGAAELRSKLDKYKAGKGCVWSRSTTVWSRLEQIFAGD